MKNIILTISAILFTALATHAQTSSPLRTHPQADSIKNERVQLEKETELKILEKLEQSRLQEERARMQKIEATNFSVVNPAPAASAQTQTF